MAWKRKSRAELMAWMNGHPAAWEGFPKQGNTREHSGRIFAAMQADGLFAPRSNNAVSEEHVFELCGVPYAEPHRR